MFVFVALVVLEVVARIFHRFYRSANFHYRGQSGFTACNWISWWNDVKGMALATVGESGEFWEEVVKRDYWAMLNEAGDVVYSVVKFVLTACLGKGIVWLHFPWFLLYVFSPMTAKKFAGRFEEHGCPRSRRNCAKGGHVCPRK